MPIGSKPNERRGGRQKGTPNKRTAAREQAVAEMLNVIPEASQGDAHAFLMAIYKDPTMPVEMRIDAAKKAIHFESRPERRYRRRPDRLSSS
jgi:hypothetical protein